MIDKAFKLGPNNDQTHLFTLNEIDSEQFKSKPSFKLKTLHIDVVASLKSQDHLPSRSLKKMLNDIWKQLEKDKCEKSQNENLFIGSKSELTNPVQSEIVKTDIVFPFELLRSLLV